MKLSKIILASIIAFIPLKALAQPSSWLGYPQWAKYQKNPVQFVPLYNDGPFSYAIDKNFIPLNNGSYGIFLYTLGNSSGPTYYSKAYYEFDCKSGRYLYQGERTGQMNNKQIEEMTWIPPCQTQSCKDVSKIKDYLLPGIKKYCPR